MGNPRNDTTAVLDGNLLEEPAKVLPVPAALRLKRGKIMIAIGTIFALLGIVVYSTTMLVGDVNQEPARFMGEGLILIGIGLGFWLTGAIRYLNAAMDLGHTDDTL
jgi:hypothetical protein